MDLSSKVVHFNVNYQRPYWEVTLAEASQWPCDWAHTSMSVVVTFTAVHSVTILQLEPYYVLTDAHVCKVDNSQNDSYVCTSECLFELFRVQILSASYKPAYLGSLMPSVFTIFFTTYAMRALGRWTHPLYLFRQKSSVIASKATEIQGATSKLSCRQINAAFSRWRWTLCEYTEERNDTMWQKPCQLATLEIKTSSVHWRHSKEWRTAYCAGRATQVTATNIQQGRDKVNIVQKIVIVFLKLLHPRYNKKMLQSRNRKTFVTRFLKCQCKPVNNRQ